MLVALHAYERLRAEHATDSDPGTVFRRWPYCTVVTLVRLVADSPDPGEPRGALSPPAVETALGPAAETPVTIDADTWLRAFAAAWHTLTERDRNELTAHPDERHTTALAALLSTAGTGEPQAATFEAGLDPDRGTVVLTSDATLPRLWRVRAGSAVCPSVENHWLVTRPVETVECRDPFGQSQWVPLVSPDDPLLVFDTEGALIPSGEPIPAGEVWLLHRGEPGPGCFDGKRHVLEELAPPNGWSGWWLGRVLLDETRGVRPGIGDGRAGTRFGTWRTVNLATHAEFTFDAPVPTLRDRDGDSVHSAAPVLHLTGDDTQRWTVEIIGDTPGQSASWEVNATDGPVELDELMPRSAMGRFRIRAVDSGGQASSTTFTLVKGLGATPTPRVRMLRETGQLYRARVSIRTPENVLAVPETVQLRESARSGAVELRTADETRRLTLRVEPEHAAMRKRLGTHNQDWGINRLHYTLGQLSENACLDLSLPEVIREAHEGSPVLLAHDGSDTLQQLRGQRLPASDVIRYKLAGLIDTVRAHGSLRLRLDLPGQGVELATVRLPKPASGVRKQDARLLITERATRERLRVRVDCPYTPWRPTHTVELAASEDTVQLPPRFDTEAPLLVTVHHSWAQPNRTGGVTPSEAGSVFRVGDESRIPELAEPVEQETAGYLAGRGSLPRTTTALPLLWASAARAEQLLEPASGRTTAKECAMRLGDDPVASLLASSDSGTSARDLIPVIVRSGIAAHASRHVADPERVRSLWTSRPLPALLLTGPLLFYRTGSTGWQQDELDTTETALLDTFDQRCAPRALELLTGDRTDPDENTPPLLGEQTPEHPTPSGELTLTAESLDELRNCRNELRRFIYRKRYPELFEIASRRRTADPHPDFPLERLSLELALTARLAAQRDRDAAAVERLVRHGWTHLAELAPDRVATDLVLAEFLTVAHQARQEQRARQEQQSNETSPTPQHSRKNPS
ncbi:hypothetical protein SAMN04487905_11234 [Actinopolyspora xinjiangensis]|uniref:Uncharacterized protein n=1 Tax=Actinopolyspora xinjiangensis TaxID=405564 RepID=A0A1H0WFZ4_9ACTN|nr:hypothetical protein [Actinopolyspora xinjiangensis]SDP89577.1 hypothetical protein SAMN04487905_11234 [Actinopolyspora xinjiangensis]